MNDQELMNAIAVEVMGYRALIRDPHTDATRWAEPGESLPLYGVEWFDGDRQTTPPTITYSGMGRVIEKMRDEGYEVAAFAESDTQAGSKYTSIVEKKTDKEPFWSAYAEIDSDQSLPRAVLLAALTAARSHQPKETP